MRVGAPLRKPISGARRGSVFVVQSLCPRCGKHTEGDMIDHELYITVICDNCEVILGVLPKFYQKATWKKGKAREEAEEDEEAAPTQPSAKKAEPGAAVIKALEGKKRAEDRRLRWS